MKNLGAAIAGGNGKRTADDFYATPPEALIALLRSGALHDFPSRIWEPACGDGAMSRLLLADRFDVVSTDLVDRGYEDGLGGIDFLATTVPLAQGIITNPPFALAAKFIQHAWNLRIPFVALLLKATFFHAASRVQMFEEIPPAWILPVTWRLDFTGGGAPTMDCSWFVWDDEIKTHPRAALLRKPA